ncbi:MAG TPA: phage Gp37/Gp68 family protein [Tepidisphaeraceae bacterium]|nr:phage Gp37/Gp68 family protein [Tepidisphaeraceae bacterium]
MANGSSIEWTDATWNPVAGCTPVSAGCRNCYAARMALRLAHMPNGIGEKYKGTATRTRGGLPVFTGAIKLDRDSLHLPREWRLPRMIFVNSMSDVFHERVPLGYAKEIFDVMASCPQHTFQLLTKRPERAAGFAAEFSWPNNVWMGTSIEDERVLHRVDALRSIPARLRFLSCEPLIGPLNGLSLENIHWVIVGGESGPGARPMEEAWVLQIKSLCAKNDVPFFFKQWGGVNKKAKGRKLQGKEWNHWPKRLPLQQKMFEGADVQ